MDISERPNRIQNRDPKLGFFIHLGVYVVVNAGLAALNLINNPNHLWFYWVLLGWGAGILLHAFLAFFTGHGRSAKAG